MFRVSNGAFVKHISTPVGTTMTSFNDVMFAPNGELLFADYSNRHVCVFNSDEGTLLRSWRTTSEDELELRSPIALALVDSKLFVLEQLGRRVQVFE